MVRSLFHVLDPNIEVAHAAKAIALLKHRYSKPFSVPSVIVQNEENIRRYVEQENSQPQLVSSQVQDENQTPEQRFQHVLLEYIEKEYSTDHFSCHEAGRGDRTLEHLARQTLTEKYHRDPTPRQITELFVSSVNGLAKAGQIIQVDGPSGMYRILTNEELEDVILDVIEKASTTATLHHGGVLREYIIQQVISEEPYRRLCRDRILHCLNSMVANSILYNTGFREYKIVA